MTDHIASQIEDVRVKWWKMNSSLKKERKKQINKMECKTAKQCCRNANNCGWFYGVHSFCLPYCCWWCVVAFFAMTFTWRQLLIESNLKTNNSRKRTKIKCSKEDKENSENILWPVFTAQKEVRPVRHTASVIFLLCSYSFLTTTSCSKQSPNVLSLCWLLLLILRHVCFFVCFFFCIFGILFFFMEHKLNTSSS